MVLRCGEWRRCVFLRSIIPCHQNRPSIHEAICPRQPISFIPSSFLFYLSLIYSSSSWYLYVVCAWYPPTEIPDRAIWFLLFAGLHFMWYHRGYTSKHTCWWIKNFENYSDWRSGTRRVTHQKWIHHFTIEGEKMDHRENISIDLIFSLVRFYPPVN
jgi:hypothetical protein